MIDILKRCLSFLTALIIVVTSGVVTFAGENSANTGISAETAEAMEVLKLFSVIHDYSDYNVNLSEGVSRADFAETLAKLINCAEYTGDKVYYYDVPKSHYAFGSISQLTEMGVVGGNGNKLFNPDNIVETNEALKMVVSILGYTTRAEVEGGYPSGYANVAKRLGLTNGLSMNRELCREDMFLLLYRSLNVEMFVVTAITPGDGVEYRVSETDTILSVYHNVVYYSGVVQGAMMVSLTDTALKDPDEVIINGKRYNSEIDLSDMLGEKVRFMVRDNRKTGGDEMVIKAKRIEESDVVKINGDNKGNFDKNTYSLSYYTQNGNQRNIKIEKDALFIYNGRELGSNISETMNSDIESIKLIKNSNGLYKTVIIKSYENYVVGTINTAQKVIFDKARTGRSFKINEDDYDFLIFKDAEGNEILAESIKQGDVLSVFISKDEKYAEAIVNSRIIAGVTESIKTLNGKNYVTIGENTYCFKDDADIQKIKAGSNVELYLDFSGKVAYTEVSSDKRFAAFVYSYSFKDQDFDKSLLFKIFTENGEMLIAGCADSVRLDGKTEKSFEKILERFMSGGAFKPQLVLTEVNSKNEIKLIDTANENYTLENEGNVLKQNLKDECLWYKSGGYFADKAVMNEKTKIFAVPENFSGAKDSDFRILAMKDFANDSWPTIDTFTTEKRSGYEEYVVAKKKGRDYADFSTSDLPIIVDETGMMLNSEENLVEYISGYQGENTVSIMADESYSFACDGIKEGMVVRPKINGYGYAVDVTVCYDPHVVDTAHNGGEVNTNINAFGASWRCEVGYVNDIVGDVIKIGFKKPDEIDHITNLNKAVVLTYNSANAGKKVSEGSFADAITYQNSTANCSTVVLVSIHGVPKLYVFYN